MLQVRLLGPLTVLDDSGAELTPPGAREQLCLATLAIVAPQALSTERLADELYRDKEASDPRHAVQAVISRLRRALGRAAGAVETTSTGYRVVDVTLDVDDAQQKLEEALEQQEPGTAGRLLDEAAALWRGPTLEGLAGDLVDAERLRIDGLRADGAEAVAQRHLDAGVDHRLLASLEAAVGEHPLRERRWEQLMLALYRAGRQAEALRAFQRARTQLSEHLGLDPGPSLVELERRILAQDPGLVPEPVTGAGPSDSEPSSGRTSPLPSGTVTVVLCDVEGSVRRWEADPVDTAADIARLHELWSEATASLGGTVVKSTGDGVLSVFATAATALEASVEALAHQERTSLSVRVAAYSGTLQPVDGDYRGPVVNRCARLLELAHGGQILTSTVTAELARAELPPTITLRDLGPQWLRDVSDPVSVVQVDGPGLRSAFGPLRSQGPARLPRLRGSLLGRDELVDDVVTKVGDEALVSLLGPGGIGKTSVALAVAWRLVDSRPVTFVDLGRVTDPGAVTERIIDELALPDHDEGRDPVDRIADRLRVGTDLVIIDNAEHLLDAVADILDPVLAFELKGSFLVTSRQPLGLAGETIVGVPPLDLPNEDDDLESTGRSPSVQLFVERVRATRSATEISSGLLPVVAHICRRLDGIPLAIELAAGRASVLAVDDIAARLDDQLRLLRQLQSTRERRHRSLEAVVGWSVDQLSASARELFDRLAVMAGSFSATGAERLLAHCGLETLGVLDDLDELAGASLLVPEHGSGRLRMLEPVRQYALAGLTAAGTEPESRRAYVAWLTELVGEAHGRRDETRQDAMAAIDVESDHVVAALTWITEAGATELVSPLALHSGWWFLTRDAMNGDRVLGALLPIVDREREPLVWAEVVVALAISTAAHPRSDVAESVLDALDIMEQNQHPDLGLALVAAAFAQTGLSDPTLPLELLARAEQTVSSDDRWATAIVDMASMIMDGLLLTLDPSATDGTFAVARGERALIVLRTMGERWALGVSLGELGRIHQLLGDFETAEQRFAESLEVLEGSDFHGQHYVFTELGRLASLKGEHDRAEGLHRRAMVIAENDGNAGCIAMSYAGMAHAAEARAEPETAIELYRRALDLMNHSSLVEHGASEWHAALARLTGEAMADTSSETGTE